MDYLNEKVAYLRGLAEGLGIAESTTNEGKIMANIIDILDDIVEAIAELEASQAELDEYVENIDEDLSDIENQIYGDAEFDESEEPEYIEVECPNCNETVYFDRELFDSDEDLVCPNCHETIYAEDVEELDDEFESDADE